MVNSTHSNNVNSASKMSKSFSPAENQVPFQSTQLKPRSTILMQEMKDKTVNDNNNNNNNTHLSHNNLTHMHTTEKQFQQPCSQYYYCFHRLSDTPYTCFRYNIDKNSQNCLADASDISLKYYHSLLSHYKPEVTGGETFTSVGDCLNVLNAFNYRVNCVNCVNRQVNHTNDEQYSRDDNTGLFGPCVWQSWKSWVD
ncbi:unnamed protein product [Trichobilharzia regenti]|nr:unnamed protein product [Trichobilharzia regenti]